MVSNNDFVVVMSGDKNYAFAIGNVLVGLKKHNPKLVDKVIIFQSEFAKSDKNAIRKIYPTTEFIDYLPSRNKHLENIVNHYKKIGYKKWPYFCYGIFEIFNIISTCKYVLYLDGDIVIKHDISGILNHGTIALRPGGRPLDVALGISDEKLHSIQCRNSGVVILKNNIDFSGFTEQCYSLADEYKETNILPDQSILNLVLLKNNVIISELPKRYNDNLNSSENHYIIHQTTSEKFWNNAIASAIEQEFNENSLIFKTFGGQIYRGDIKYSYVNNWVKKNYFLKFSSLIHIYEFHYKKIIGDIVSIFSCYPLFIDIKENRIFGLFDLHTNYICRYEIWLEPDIIYTKIFTNNKYYIDDIDILGFEKIIQPGKNKYLIQKTNKFIDLIVDDNNDYMLQLKQFINLSYKNITEKMNKCEYY